MLFKINVFPVLSIVFNVGVMLLLFGTAAFHCRNFDFMAIAMYKNNPPEWINMSNVQFFSLN